MTDLYLTKEEILWERLRHYGFFSSVMARQVGLDIYYTRADRTVREWAQQGRVRRLDRYETAWRGLRKKGQAPVVWYEVSMSIGEGK